jgi:DNA uptake protein ComE-like DNA-binding protein
MRNDYKHIAEYKHPGGSALILAVVISSMLAIVGILFVMVARIDKIASSSISENMELNYAVDTATAKISQQLALDIPGVADSNNQEYYDFPDANNTWLSELEPYRNGSNYYWKQISDLSGSVPGGNRNIMVKVIPEYEAIADINSPLAVTTADADGDGIGDSKWEKLKDVNTRTGQPIYSAVRIIDNSAMLNANTAYQIDPADSAEYISNLNQMQINFMALAARPGNILPAGKDIELLQARANYGLDVNPLDLQNYQENVLWRFGEPNGAYTPFDVSDELEMRYRFLLNHKDIDARLENWSNEFRFSTLTTPVASAGRELDNWYKRSHAENIIDPNYAFRHVTTVYSMDRVINPAGKKMVNINQADADALFNAIRTGLQEPNAAAADAIAAQLAVNIIDYRDDNIDITTLVKNGKTYYGFEAQPFISEIVCAYFPRRNVAFAVELYNPFDVDIPLGDFRIELRKDNGEVAKTIKLSPYVIAKKDRFVIANDSTSTGFQPVTPLGHAKEDANMVLAEYIISGDPPKQTVSQKYNIYLLRNVTGKSLYIDKQQTQSTWFDLEDINQLLSRSYRRADTNWNIIYQDLRSDSNNGPSNLGEANAVAGTRKNYNLSNPSGNFLTVGDISRVLTISPVGTDPNEMIGIRLNSEPNESEVRIDLLNPKYTNIFQYLTVIDPAEHRQPAAETRIKGRININTAPWFVISQLPGMLPAVAQQIVLSRDNTGAFRSIAELMRIPQMGYYANDPSQSSVDLNGWPDLTPSDGAIDDFEERDMIFSRISNLATVRSDIFTAYILVRLGTDGPQKRVIAVFDRNRVTTNSDKPKILAIQSVPDPR